MKKILILAAMILVLGSGFCGNVLMNAMADDSRECQPVVFYKSVLIGEGDTLWGIAEEYAPALNLSIPEYVDALKRMNRLKEDTIHCGRYLTVMYDGAAG